MKAKFLLFAFIATVLAACNTNEPEKKIQTYTIDDLCISYYVSGSKNDVREQYVQNEWIRVHIDIHNQGQNTMMVDVIHWGDCYNSNNEKQEDLSMQDILDTVPTFRTLDPNQITQFKKSYILSVPPGSYHYQNPYIMFYHKNNPLDVKQSIIPLTVNFEVK